MSDPIAERPKKPSKSKAKYGLGFCSLFFTICSPFFLSPQNNTLSSEILHTLLAQSLLPPVIAEMSRLISYQILAITLGLLIRFQATVAATVDSNPPRVLINEILASNVSTFPDNADFDDYSDWIEFHNPSPHPTSLRNYFLTDDLSRPTRWGFPAGTTIPGNGFLIVRADGFDAIPGERKTREFSPWDSFTTQGLHTNFKLAAQGEELGLFRCDGLKTAITLTSFEAGWRFLDDGQLPNQNWSQPNFDDSLWNRGHAQFGYGEGDEKTTLNFGKDPRKKHAAYYFRRTFIVESTERLIAPKIQLLADDGAIVYLNGTEILRVRMPSGTTNQNTLAAGIANEDEFDTIGIDPSVFLSGENLLAVEVHQESHDSSDVSFDLELTASQLHSDPVLVDSVQFEQQYPNISWARNPLVDGEWGYDGNPTPQQPNEALAIETLSHSGKISFSLRSGHYQGESTLTLTSDHGKGEIRYTLDGSTPNHQSSLYQRPLDLNETTVVRARLFGPGLIPGPTVSHSYLINEPTSTIPLVSMSTDPSLFFDREKGIYQNEYKGREALCHFEFFDAEGFSRISTDLGAKIAGENIWRFAQKPLTLTLRNRYGTGSFDYPIFPQNQDSTYSQFALRNGGNNWSKAMIRDALTPFILEGQSKADVQAYQPCHTYLNGDYWGIYNIRERFDDRYFATRYHTYSGTYDYLKFAHVQGNSTALVVEEGDAKAYESLIQYASTHDLSIPVNYEFVRSQMDMDSFVDFIVLEEFVYNSSWRHNREFWKPHHEGGKWHWIISDLDRGFQFDNVKRHLLDNFMEGFPLFDRLLANESFRQELAQRFAVHLSSTLHPARIADIVDRLDAELSPEIARHIERWTEEDGIESLSTRRSELQEIKDFADEREIHVRTGIAEYLGFSNTITLSTSVNPKDSGTITLQGVPMLPQYSNTAQIYRGIPIEMTAKANPGFRFVGWSQGFGVDENTILNLNTNTHLVAEFAPSNEDVLPLSIETDHILTLSGSPYTIDESFTIQPNSTLTIEAGVHIRLAKKADIVVAGSLIVNGTASDPVVLEAREASEPWGAMAFINPNSESKLSHTNLRGGSIGRKPSEWKAMISNIGSYLEIENSNLDSGTTLFARGGTTILRSSQIRSPYTGDGINIKNGSGLVEDCTFVGNAAPDTDGIDFDGVANGVIRNNRVYGFRGLNSDGIDIGEGCSNLLITGNRIYQCSDKGISIGQGSDALIEDNLIVGCALVCRDISY
jgi:hypothetical protein